MDLGFRFMIDDYIQPYTEDRYTYHQDVYEVNSSTGTTTKETKVKQEVIHTKMPNHLKFI